MIIQNEYRVFSDVTEKKYYPRLDNEKPKFNLPFDTFNDCLSWCKEKNNEKYSNLDYGLGF